MMLVSLFVKASLLFVLAAGVQVAIARRTSAASRHLLWTLTVAGLLLLPALSAFAPSWTLSIRVPRPPDTSSVATPAATQVATTAAAPVAAAVATPVENHDLGAGPTHSRTSPASSLGPTTARPKAGVGSGCGANAVWISLGKSSSAPIDRESSGTGDASGTDDE